MSWLEPTSNWFDTMEYPEVLPDQLIPIAPLLRLKLSRTPAMGKPEEGVEVGGGGVLVGVVVDVRVGVEVAVFVGVGVAVLVGVKVDVFVGVSVNVFVAV